MSDFQRKPNPVDIHVGSRIRMRRRVLGLSQEQLASQLELTFQQVQKYERGANRVSASKLFGISAVLQVPVSYFFQGLADPGHGEGADLLTGEAETAIRGFLNTTEGLELAKRFPLIPKGRLRKQVLELVRALSEEASVLVDAD
jgi:transcriptional regulator with XRE-family HTH domain